MFECPSIIHGFVDIMKRKPDKGDFVWLSQVESTGEIMNYTVFLKALIQFKEV